MRKIIFITIMFVFLLSCKENDEKTKKELLVGEWKMTEGVIDPSVSVYDDEGYEVGTTSNFMSLLYDCELDDTDEYRADGQLLYHDNAYSCNEPEYYTPSTWMFNGDETAIIESFDQTESDIHEIISLSEKKMKLKSKAKIDGVLYTLISVYEKK